MWEIWGKGLEEDSTGKEYVALTLCLDRGKCTCNLSVDKNVEQFGEERKLQEFKSL